MPQASPSINVPVGPAWTTLYCSAERIDPTSGVAGTDGIGSLAGYTVQNLSGSNLEIRCDAVHTFGVVGDTLVLAPGSNPFMFFGKGSKTNPIRCVQGRGIGGASTAFGAPNGR